MPRTCQWPADGDATDFDSTAPSCGVRLPSYVATATDPDLAATTDPLDVCDAHKAAAETAGYTVERHTSAPRRARQATPAPDAGHPYGHPELDAMAQCLATLDGLPNEDARFRVATWLYDNLASRRTE